MFDHARRTTMSSGSVKEAEHAGQTCAFPNSSLAQGTDQVVYDVKIWRSTRGQRVLPQKTCEQVVTTAVSRRTLLQAS